MSAKNGSLDLITPRGVRLVGEVRNGRGIALAVRLPWGTKDDPSDKHGLAYMLRETLFKGAGERDAPELSDAFDYYGAKREISGNSECLTLAFGCLREHLAPVAELVREVCVSPLFSEEDCRAAKELLRQEREHLEDEPAAKVFTLLREAYFGSEWGHCSYGEEASVGRITREDVVNFWEAAFRPRGAVAAIVGDFESAAAVKAVEALFERPCRAESVPGRVGAVADEPPPPPSEEKLRHEEKDDEQIQIAAAFPSVARGERSWPAAVCALGVLAGGASGRLFTEVREKRGLAYAVGARQVLLRRRGDVFVYAGTTVARADETLTVLHKELRRAAQNLDEEELTRAKAPLKAGLAMQAETTAGRAAALLNDAWYEQRALSVKEATARLEAVTVDEVRGYWEKHPPEPWTLTTLGKRAPSMVASAR